MAALLALGACSKGGGSGGAADDKFAGLDGAIQAWRTEIASTDPLCGSQAEGQKCESFEVACKAERVITPADQAKGVTAKLVAAINWNGWDPKVKQPQPGAKTAEFTRAGGAWTRTEHAPVNMTTCADL
jgi:hypothetical protein